MFKVYTTDEVIELLRNFVFTRILNQWHIHHTWLPNYKSFTGKNHQELQLGMKDYHVGVNKWSDIGQHFTLFPDGLWLAGRDLDQVPASILGWNTGSIAVEMLGNFDVNGDTMSPEQRDAILKVTEFVTEQMNLVPHFHRDNPTSGKTCPGSGINRESFFIDVAHYTENKLLAEQRVKEEKEMNDAKAKAQAIKDIMSKKDIRFTDMIVNGNDAHWANKFVNLLNDKNIVKGIANEDGTFRFEPDRGMTRAEACTLMAKMYESLLEEIAKLKGGK